MHRVVLCLMLALALPACRSIDGRIAALNEHGSPVPAGLRRFEYVGIDRRDAGATAIAIAPDALLTARHTLPAYMLDPATPPENRRAMIQICGEMWWFAPINAGPGAHGQDSSGDWVIISRLGRGPSQIFEALSPLDASRPLTVGETVYIAGYPRLTSFDSPGVPPTVIAGRVVGVQPGADRPGVLEIAPVRGRSGYFNPDELNGMSGGAAYIVDADGKPVVIGISRGRITRRLLGFTFDWVFEVVRPNLPAQH